MRLPLLGASTDAQNPSAEAIQHTGVRATCVEEQGEGGVSGLSGGWKILRRRVDAIEKMRRRYYTDWKIVEALKDCR